MQPLDDRRPHWHHTAPEGWVNDAYGVVWRDGRYHLFFQHVPGSVEWRLEQHWGHATSEDLLAWTEQPVALSPGDGDDGVWSGTLVVDGDEALVLYTSVSSPDPGRGRVRVATPDDGDWTRWTKGPVVVEPPAGLSDVRDPFVVRDGGRWRMVQAGATDAGRGVVLTWTSEDLRRWEADGVLAGQGAGGAGEIWECPQLFVLDGAWVLLISVVTGGGPSHEVYAVGDLVHGRFEAAGPWRRLTHGPSPYAGSVFVDAEGRTCVLHWLRGPGGADQGWAGAHSVPHVLRRDGDRVVAEPHPVVPTGRELVDGEQVAFGDVVLERREGVVHVDGDAPFDFPCGEEPVTVLVDGCVVELLGAEGTAAVTLR